MKETCANQLQTGDAILDSERGDHADRSPLDQGQDASRLADGTLLAALTEAVARAAAATLGFARASLNLRIKSDGSPVTDADERSQAVLLDAMARLLPGVPVVAEEMASLPAQLDSLFVLIDPLDGTKEYAAGLNEYTVNLGLVRHGLPVLGIVAVPAAGLIYRGIVGARAERLAMAPDGHVATAGAQPIRVRAARQGALVAIVSRSHLDAATVSLLDRLGVSQRIACGSALKLCRIAEGAADIYPRLATTCEWDIAAGHALVAAAGGSVTSPEGGVLSYGASARNFRIPAFIAWGDHAGMVGNNCA
jgi:3'(2'), 5'-bisphosphate nucleotidase